MFSAHPTTDPGTIFSPKPTKKHTSELTLKIDNLGLRKNQQTDKNRLPTRSPNPLKICGNPTLDPKLSPLVSQWTPRSPTWWSKVQKFKPQDSKMKPLESNILSNQPTSTQPTSQPTSQPASQQNSSQPANQTASQPPTNQQSISQTKKPAKQPTSNQRGPAAGAKP